MSNKGGARFRTLRLLQPNRKTQRQTDFDYSKADYYSVTICTQRRSGLFGAIHNGEMLVNNAAEWFGIRGVKFRR